MIVPKKMTRRDGARGLVLPLLVSMGLVPLVACGPRGDAGAEGGAISTQEAEPVTLGPADGHDLPATDLARVAVGTMAPDFSLRTLAGDTLTLSSFRGTKDVVLVVYRGHW